MKFPILDLETTGLVVYPGAILEASVTIMDTDFVTHEEYTSAVYCSSHEFESYHPSDWVKKTHTESGLLTECFDEKTPGIEEVEDDIIRLLSKHFPEEKPVLVGNSIHFDRKWIDEYMRHLSRKLHYRLLDVSSLWEYMRIFHNMDRPDNGPVAHRGLPDTKASAKLLRQFGKYVGQRY